jgi:hypothetical protein
MTTKLTGPSDLDQTTAGEVPLPTVPVLARFRSTAPDVAAAVTDVVGRIAPVREMYDDIVVERREDDGSFWVVARFVTVSVDTHTAVLGVHDTLLTEGLEVDEVWVQG